MSDMKSKESEVTNIEQGNMTTLKEVFTNPINCVLVCFCAFLLYKIISGRKQATVAKQTEPTLPPLKKRDFTLQQLRHYIGTGEEKRILIAVNGYVFDVTRGKAVYGAGGPYALMAGRDASRSLATFSLGGDAIKDTYDDLSDLNSAQMDKIKEWEMQFREKYDFVGRLLRPGEEPHDYTDNEEELIGGHDKPHVE